MEIRYLGHSAFELHTGGRRILVDPFLTDNPKAAARAEEFTEVDLVLLTHDHADHLGDTFDICKRTSATLFAVFEVATRAGEEGITVEPMSVGGGVDVEGLRVNMVNAQHSCGEGHPAGFVLEAEGKSLYFAGDTGLFGDMKLYGELWDLDLAVLPIGDRFTMGPAHAAKAVELLGASHVIPCHYGTWPLLLPDASTFVQAVGDRAKVHALAPGETLELN